MVAKKTKKTTSVKKTNQADELKKNKAKYNALNKKYKAL